MVAAEARLAAAAKPADGHTPANPNHHDAAIASHWPTDRPTTRAIVLALSILANPSTRSRSGARHRSALCGENLSTTRSKSLSQRSRRRMTSHIPADRTTTAGTSTPATPCIHGAAAGTSTVCSYIESASGVTAGGRTLG